MNREKLLCFIVQNKNLYLDKVLVSFNEIPIFYICKDEKEEYYTVLCIDIENTEYIIVKSSVKDLYDMLTKKIAMRKIFTKASSFWQVTAGEIPEEDCIEYKGIESIDYGVLPFEGEKYNVCSFKDEEYIKEIEDIYINKGYYRKSSFISLSVGNEQIKELSCCSVEEIWKLWNFGALACKQQFFESTVKNETDLYENEMQEVKRIKFSLENMQMHYDWNAA